MQRMFQVGLAQVLGVLCAPEIDPRDYGMSGARGTAPQRTERHPALTLDTLGGVDAAVLQVHDARLGIRMSSGRKRGLLEVPVNGELHALWLSLNCIQTLIEKLGSNTDEWIGARVPVVKVRVQNPETEEYVIKYNVAHPDDWADLIREHDERAEAAKADAAPAASKRRGK